MSTRIIHECSQAESIKNIKDEVDDLTICVNVLKPEVERVVRILEGNGQKGLKEVVIQLNGNVSELTTRLEESSSDRRSLHEAITGLINYKAGLQATFEEQNKENTRMEVKREVKGNNTRWLIALLIASLIAIAGILIDLKIAKDKINMLNKQVIIEEKK
jgi:hypothetical protein